MALERSHLKTWTCTGPTMLPGSEGGRWTVGWPKAEVLNLGSGLELPGSV